MGQMNTAPKKLLIIMLLALQFLIIVGLAINFGLMEEKAPKRPLETSQSDVYSLSNKAK